MINRSYATVFKKLEGTLPNVEIILPRVTSDLLMLPPSFSLSPVAPDASTRSLQSGAHHSNFVLSILLDKAKTLKSGK